MPAAIDLGGFEDVTPAENRFDLGGFEDVTPTAVITVPPIDEDRATRRQRVTEFDTGLNPFSGSEFGRGVAKSALSMGASTAGFGEALAGLVGADSAKAWLKEKGDSLEELSRSIPQAVESFTQIRNPADVAAYTLAAIGELAPQIVLSLGAGLGLRAAGMGVKTAAVIGAAATSYPQEAGGIYRGIREETGQDAPLTALAFGAPAAALDTLTPARFLGKVFDSAGDELKSKAWTALVKRSFVEAAKAAPVEGLTEAMQESIAVSANKFADQTYVMVNGTNFIRVLDAGIQGVIGGGVLGFSAPVLGSSLGKNGEATAATEISNAANLAETAVNQLTAATAANPRSSALRSSRDEIVLSLLQNDEVFNSVVRLVPVDVVDNLVGQKNATEVVLHDHSMLLKSLAANLEGNVFRRFIDSAGDAVALLGAKLATPGLALPDLERDTAISARHLDRKAIVDAIAIYHSSDRNTPKGTELSSGPAARTKVPSKIDAALFANLFKQHDAILNESTQESSGDVSKRLNQPVASPAAPPVPQPTGNESLTANQPATQPQPVAPPTPEISRETVKPPGEVPTAVKIERLKRSIRGAEGLLSGTMAIGGFGSDGPRVPTVEEMVTLQSDLDRDKAELAALEPSAQAPPVAPQAPAIAARRQTDMISGGTQGPLASMGPETAPEASLPFTVPPSGRLRHLSNLPFTPAQRAVYDALIKAGFGEVSFRLVNDPTLRYGGGFVGENGFILNTPRLAGRPDYTKRIIIHEAVHAATYEAIRDPKFVKQFSRLESLVEVAKTSFYAKFEGIQKGQRMRFQHALSSVDEFVSAALTDQQFQEFLSNVRPNKRNRATGRTARFAGSVLNKFWEIIASIFGVKASVLSETLAITDELISAGMVTEKTLGDTDKIPTVAEWITIEDNPGVQQETPPPSGADATTLLASLGPTLKAADLEKTIAFTPDPAVQRTEAVMASGQTTGLLGVLRDHLVALANQFIPAGLTPAEQQRRAARAAFIVDVTRLEGIENLAQQLGVTPQQFDAALNAMPDAGMKTLISKHWFDQFNLIERNARRTTAKRFEAAAKVASPGFQQKLRNLRVQFNRRDMAEQARLLIVAQLKNGLDQARARIGQAGVNETLLATANEQVRLFSELLQRVDPIERRMRDIIAAANNSPAFFQAIMDGTFTTPEEFLNAYLATSPALPGPGPEMVELRVAADILHRTRDLALRMTAAIASEDAAVNQAVTNLEDRIRQSVDAGNFRTVVHNVLRKVVSYASKEGKAAAIVNITQKPLLRQIEALEAIEFGEAVFNATLADPRYRTMRNRANELVGAFPRPAHALKEKGEPLTPLSSPFLPEHTVYLPDGTTAVFKMSSNKSDWDAQRQSIDDALTALTAWLAANPATDPAHDVYRTFYQWEFDTLNTLWHASFAFDSPKMFPAFRNFHFKMLDSMLKMFDSLADSIGTRDINLAKSLAGILKDVMHQMSDWSSKNSQAITHTMYLAIRSHPEIADGNRLDAAGRQWFREVLNPIFASLRNPGKPGYRTGDIIASSGRKVTRQDMEAARRQAKSTADAMAINVAQDRLNYATPPLVEDRIIPGAPALRRVLTLSPTMVPRRFGKDGRDVASQFIAEAIQGSVTPQAFWRDLNRWHHVKSMVEDRGEEYSTVSPLQLEDAFRAAKAELQRDPSSIDDIQSLADFMAQHTTATPDEIEAFIGSEMTRSVNAFINAIPDLQQRKKGGPVPEFDIKAWEQANAFTLGRTKSLAPPSFYEYGFKDTAGILNFATSGNSFYMDQFVQSLREIAAKMRTYRDNVIKKRTDELVRTMGETKGTEEVRAENRENIRLGNETLLWEKVDDYANSIDGFVKTFNENYTVGGKETELQVRTADNVLSRLVGGILSGIVGTVRNAIDGGFYHNGVRLSRLESSTLRAFPRAAYHVLKTVIPLGMRTVPAVIKGVFTTFGQFPSAAMTLARTGNLLKAEGRLFGKAVDDVANSLFGVKELNQQLKNRGLAMHVTPSETVENIADFWRSQGVNREVVISGNPFGRLMQTAGQFFGSAVDVQLALFAKPFFPRVGDIIANEAVSGATLGALKNFEKRFRILADTFQRMGITGAALANRQFTAKEVFGAFPGLGTKIEDLRLLEQWFVESNVDFHRSLADWFKRLETDPASQWLTPEEKWRLAARSVEVINAPTPFNRPLALRDNFLTRMIGLVLGWNIHAYRQQAAYIGQSANNPNSQFKIRTAIALWMLVILAAADASNEGTELLVRLITRLMGDPERSTRLPHEHEAAVDQLKSHLVYAFNSVPFVANVMNSALNDSPNKAAFGTTLLIQNKITDFINYVGGVINSGDLGYRLPQTIRGLAPHPGLIVALNQLPEISGQKPAVDVSRLYSRYGEKELLAKPYLRSGPGASANVTPLSPYGDRLIAAVISGDTEKADRLYTEAIQIATRLGKRDPEQSVRGMLLSSLPISRAFKTTPTPQQYSALLGRMSASQRGRVSDFNQRATIGLSRLGIETNKIYPIATARTTGTSTSTSGRTARSRGYRTRSGIRRVRLGRSRSRLGTRRRRNSLVRQAV